MFVAHFNSSPMMSDFSLCEKSLIRGEEYNILQSTTYYTRVQYITQEYNILHKSTTYYKSSRLPGKRTFFLASRKSVFLRSKLTHPETILHAMV